MFIVKWLAEFCFSIKKKSKATIIMACWCISTTNIGQKEWCILVACAMSAVGTKKLHKSVSFIVFVCSIANKKKKTRQQQQRRTK